MATDIELNDIIEKDMKDIVIIGLDQSLACTGYGVVKGGTLIESGVFKAPSILTKQRDCIRRDFVRHNVDKIIEKYNPDMIFFENNHFAGAMFIKSFEQLVGLRSFLENHFYSEKIPFDLVLPSTWRKEIGVSNKRGVDKKKEAIDLLEKITGTRYPEDEAEAILIAVFGSRYLRKVKRYGLEKIKEEFAPKKKARRRTKKK